MRKIVVKDEEIIKQIQARLKAGEDFAALAKELSTDYTASSGGDSGWIAIGQGDEMIEQVALSLQIGQVSEPFQNTLGEWLIIQVLGNEIRPVSQYDFQTLKEEKFRSWLAEQRTDVNVQLFDLWKENVPTEPALPQLNP